MLRFGNLGMSAGHRVRRLSAVASLPATVPVIIHGVDDIAGMHSDFVPSIGSRYKWKIVVNISHLPKWNDVPHKMAKYMQRRSIYIYIYI